MITLPLEFKNLVSGLTQISEESFSYFELNEFFDINFTVIKSDSEIRPHVHETDVFNFIVSGKVTLTIDGEMATYGPNSLILISSGVVHSLKALGSVIVLEFWRK